MVDLSQDLYGFFKGIRIWTFTLVFNVGMEKSENKEYGFILNGNEQKNIFTYSERAAKEIFENVPNYH